MFLNISSKGYGVVYSMQERHYLFFIYLYARKPKLGRGNCGATVGLLDSKLQKRTVAYPSGASSGAWERPSCPDLLTPCL